MGLAEELKDVLGKHLWTSSFADLFKEMASHIDSHYVKREDVAKVEVRQEWRDCPKCGYPMSKLNSVCKPDKPCEHEWNDSQIDGGSVCIKCFKRAYVDKPKDKPKLPEKIGNSTILNEIDESSITYTDACLNVFEDKINEIISYLEAWRRSEK